MTRLAWLPLVAVACATEPSVDDHAVATIAPLTADARGVPRMLVGAGLAPVRAPTATAAGGAYLAQLASAWGVAPGALPELQPIAELPASRGTIARFAQRIAGLPVERGELRVLIGRDGGLVLATGTMFGSDTPRTAARFAEPDTGAIARAMQHVYGEPFDGRALVEQRGAAADGTRIVAGRHGRLEVQLARAQQVWHPVDGTLVAAWVVEAYAGRADSTAGEAFRTVIAGADGAVLAHDSLVADAGFTYRVFAEPTGELHPFDGPHADAVPHPTGTMNGSYPAFVAPVLVTVDGLNHPAGTAPPDPWLAAGRTETLGNNVEAYVDVNPPSGLSFGDFRATATAPGTFDRTYDTALGPLTSPAQQMAGVTQLFYAINWLHDFWYDAGFTEAAGNGQDNNYGRGGKDHDAILAEGQDNANGGSRNNANMSTPSDGLPPRMQVFLWSGKDDRTLALQPSGRSPYVGQVAFGPTLYDTTAAIVLGTDATAPVNDACTDLIGDVTGKIVLVDRGLCTIKTKTLNVQAHGGVGVIVANNVGGVSPPNFADDPMIPTPITIGTLVVTQVEGAAIKADLGAGPVTATLHRGTPARELDGDLDTSVIAHEYGHYLHHRLNACGNSICRAVSEGWGDFNALLLASRPGDDLMGAYPVGIYSTVNFTIDPAYFGIRRAPYSANHAINALSFRHIADGTALPASHPFLPTGLNSEVHNAGEIWAATMWEIYTALQQRPGAVFEDVRKAMATYVVSGLQMMPADPTPMESREALLAAASDADRPVMLEAFARRGMGSCALPPPPASASFTGLVESTVVKGTAIPSAIVLADTVASCDGDGILDNNETARVAFSLTNTGHVELADVVVTPTTASPGVTILSKPIAIAKFPPGIARSIEVDVAMDDTATGPVDGLIRLAIAAPGACTETLDLPIVVPLNADTRPSASATDAFDAVSVWRQGNGPAGAWAQQRRSGLDGYWRGADLATIADASLVSPRVTVGNGALSVTFEHRYAFELAAAAPPNPARAFDGGVIEYSVDNGSTWRDVATVAGVTPGYGLALDVASGNPLGGRDAYTGTNPSSPNPDTVTLDFGNRLANAELLLRFRIGTDQAGGAAGWEIDNVAFTGLAGTPFPVLEADDGVCGEPNGQPGGDPGGCCSAGPLRPASAGLGLGVLALLLRRRRTPHRQRSASC